MRREEAIALIREYENSVVYIDTEKSRKLERLSQLQLLGDYPNFGFDTILQRPSCLVNKQTAGQKPGNGYDLASLARTGKDLGKNKRAR